MDKKSKFGWLGLGGVTLISVIGFLWKEYTDCSRTPVNSGTLVIVEHEKWLKEEPGRQRRATEGARNHLEKTESEFRRILTASSVAAGIETVERVRGQLCEAYRVATGASHTQCAVFKEATSGGVGLSEISQHTWSEALNRAGLPTAAGQAVAVQIENAAVQACDLSVKMVGNASQYAAWNYKKDPGWFDDTLKELTRALEILKKCASERGVDWSRGKDVWLAQVTEAKTARDKAQAEWERLRSQRVEFELSATAKEKLLAARDECSRKLGLCRVALRVHSECEQIDMAIRRYGGAK